MGLTPSPPLEHLGPQVYFALGIYTDFKIDPVVGH